MNFNPVELAVLSKVFEAKNKEVAPGTHSVDLTVKLRVQGQVSKSEDTTAVGTVSVPIYAALALFLDKMTPTKRKRVLGQLGACMQLALLQQGNKSDNLINALDLHEMKESIEKTFKENVPRINCSGRTSVSRLVVEVLEK